MNEGVVRQSANRQSANYVKATIRQQKYTNHLNIKFI
jgi:hypothetical protein